MGARERGNIVPSLVRVATHRKLAIMAATNDVAQKELASEILETMLTEHKAEVEQIIKELKRR